MQPARTLALLLSSRFGKLIIAFIFFGSAYLFSFDFGGRTETPAIDGFTGTLHSKETLVKSELDTLIRIAAGKDYDDVFRYRPERYNDLFRQHGIVLFIYHGDSLKFWTDNSVAVENYMREVCLDDRIVNLKNGWFETVHKTDNYGRTFIGLILLKHKYSYQNQYLVNSFQQDFKLPPETQLEPNKPNSPYAIKDADGEYLFSLNFRSSGMAEAPLWQTSLNVILNKIGRAHV